MSFARAAYYVGLSVLVAAGNSSALQAPSEENRKQLIEVLDGVARSVAQSEPARAKSASDLFAQADYLKAEETERAARGYLRQCLAPGVVTGRGEFLALVRQTVEGRSPANCEPKDVDMVVRQWARIIEAKLELRGGTAPVESASTYFDKRQSSYLDKLPRDGKTDEVKRLLLAEQELRRKLAAFFQFYEDNPAKLARVIDDSHLKLVLDPKTSEEVIDSTHRSVAAWREALHALRPLVGKTAK